MPSKALLVVAALVAAAATTAAMSIGFAADGGLEARIDEPDDWALASNGDPGRYGGEALAQGDLSDRGSDDQRAPVAEGGAAGDSGRDRCAGPSCESQSRTGASRHGRALVGPSRPPRSRIGTLSRRGPLSRSPSGAGSSQDELEAAEGGEAEEDADLRRYLTDFDESAEELLSLSDILAAPSNVVTEEDHVSLVAWQVRNREPRGSYLYALQQDHAGRIVQIHRYFCPQRRLDILAETCVPVGTIYSNSGSPVAVGYSEEGAPIEGAAEDLDTSLFSQGEGYVEANEYLIFLQAYFDSLRME